MEVRMATFTALFIENAEYTHGRLPHFRHSKKRGGLSVALADGSGKYMKAIKWVNNPSNGELFVQRYAPRIRISPYPVGNRTGYPDP